MGGHGAGKRHERCQAALWGHVPAGELTGLVVPGPLPSKPYPAARPAANAADTAAAACGRGVEPPGAVPRPASAASSMASEAAPQQQQRTVGAWALGSHIGAGSFAIVWRARHVHTGQEAAVKEIALSKLNAKLRQSLESEVAILKRIRHENIVQVGWGWGGGGREGGSCRRRPGHAAGRRRPTPGGLHRPPPRFPVGMRVLTPCAPPASHLPAPVLRAAAGGDRGARPPPQPGRRPGCPAAFPQLLHATCRSGCHAAVPGWRVPGRSAIAEGSACSPGMPLPAAASVAGRHCARLLHMRRPGSQPALPS